MSYNEYFALNENPFSITPDPRFVYLSDIHQQALEHLQQGATGSADGFVLLTGEVGTGKTTICRAFLRQLPRNTEVVLILNPILSLTEFLQTICDDLRIEIIGSRRSNKNLIDHFNRFLLQVYAVGRKTILIVDEAQNLSHELLEQIRLLTNLETDTDKLLRIFLIGQPELRETLQRSDLQQVAQRITSRFHLGPLSKAQTRAYIETRLTIAGADHITFTASAIRGIYDYAKGIPRLINVLCDKTLQSAYLMTKDRIDAKVVRHALQRLHGTEVQSRRGYGRLAWVGTAGAAIAGAAFLAMNHLPGIPLVPPVGQPLVAPAPPTGVAVLPETGREGDLKQPPAATVATAATKLSTDDAETTVQPETRLTATVPVVAEQMADPATQLTDTDTDTVATVAPSTPTAVTTPSLGEPQLTAATQGLPSTDERPLQHTTADSLARNSRDYAEDELRKMWGIDEPRSGGLDFCQDVALHNLHCLNARGGLVGLAKYNRPAILYLNIADVPAYALMLKLGSGKVVLDVLGKEYVLSTESLTQVWDGGFRILWRRPPNIAGNIALGAGGIEAIWLRRAMDRIQGEQSTGDVYNEQLLTRVKQFQREAGLTPDGIVGPRTFILLQNKLAKLES